MTLGCWRDVTFSQTNLEPGLWTRGGGSRPPHTPPHFLSAAPAASPKIHGVENPWKILGRSMDKSRVFGNSDFGKKSRFENKLAVFPKVLKVWENVYNVVALTFRCGSRRGSPGIDFSKGNGDLDLRQYWENNKHNIEKITNTNNVFDVLWDQMSPKKGGMSPRTIPHPSHLPEAHFY